MSEIRKATDVVDDKIFGEIWSFILDNYTENDGELLQAYLALRASCAIIENTLKIERMEVAVDDMGV